MESLSVKSVLKKININQYIMYRTVLIIPLLLLIVYLSGKLTMDFNNFGTIFAILIFATLNQYSYFASLGKLNIVIHSMVRGIDIILTTFLLYITGIETLKMLQILGVIFVFIGIYLSINKNKQDGGCIQINKGGLILCLISVMASSLTALFTKSGLNNNIVSPSSIVLIEFIGLALYSTILLLTKKADFSKFKGSYKGVGIVAICMPILRFSQTFAFEHLGVSITNSIKSLKTFPLYGYNLLTGIEKFNARKTIGIFLSIIGTFIVILC